MVLKIWEISKIKIKINCVNLKKHEIKVEVDGLKKWS